MSNGFGLTHEDVFAGDFFVETQSGAYAYPLKRGVIVDPKLQRYNSSPEWLVTGSPVTVVNAALEAQPLQSSAVSARGMSLLVREDDPAPHIMWVAGPEGQVYASEYHHLFPGKFCGVRPALMLTLRSTFGDSNLRERYDGIVEVRRYPGGTASWEVTSTIEVNPPEWVAAPNKEEAAEALPHMVQAAMRAIHRRVETMCTCGRSVVLAGGHLAPPDRRLDKYADLVTETIKVRS